MSDGPFVRVVIVDMPDVIVHGTKGDVDALAMRAREGPERRLRFERPDGAAFETWPGFIEDIDSDPLGFADAEVYVISLGEPANKPLSR
jgi:hypothetical protein